MVSTPQTELCSTEFSFSHTRFSLAINIGVLKTALKGFNNSENGTSTHDGEQLCQIILKFIHNYCRNYGPDKFGQTDGSMHRNRTVIVTTGIGCLVAENS